MKQANKTVKARLDYIKRFREKRASRKKGKQRIGAHKYKALKISDKTHDTAMFSCSWHHAWLIHFPSR
jgi:hypothetical protein